MDKFEIQKLRELPIEGVAERLGLTIKKHRSLCCFHDDHNPSLYFNVNKNTYRCFSCGAHGGVIDLALKLLPSTGRSGGVPFIEACKWLADENNIILTEYKAPPIGEAGRGPSFDVSRYSRYFDHPWLSPDACKFLFATRHLHPAVVKFCRLNSFRDRKGINWLQIPYFDQQGRLIGLQSRNLDYQKASPMGGGLVGVPRFRFMQGERINLYNQQVIPMLRPNDPIYLAEGPSDTWALLSSGKKAVGIPSATLLKPNDLLPLAGRECHIYPDADSAGESLYQKLLSAANTIGFCLIRHDLPEGCKDFSDYWVSVNS